MLTVFGVGLQRQSNRRASGLALGGEFLQRRTDEDAQALIRCADETL